MTLAPAQRSATPIPAHLACLGSMMIWSMGLPAADFLIGHAPLVTLTALRMGIAALLVLPIWFAAEGWEAMRRANWGAGLLIGVLGFGLGAFLLLLAQQKTDAGTVAVICATAPVIGIAIECRLDGRRLHARLVTGIALSLFGGLIATADRLGSLSFGFGALIAFVSLVIYTLASRQSVKTLDTLSPIGQAALTLTGAAVGMGVIAAGAELLGGQTTDWRAFGPDQIVALAVYGGAAMGMSQLFWLIGVGRLGIGMAALYMNSAPFFVMLFLYLLGGGWDWRLVLAAAVVVLGVAIAQRPPMRRAGK